MKCQGFNHVAKSWRGKETCPKCAGGHSFKSCSNKDSSKCSNGNGPHSAAYKGCQKYKIATQVIQIASKEGISYTAAVKKQKMSVVLKQTASASVTVSADQPKSSSCRTIETQIQHRSHWRLRRFRQERLKRRLMRCWDLLRTKRRLTKKRVRIPLERNDRGVSSQEMETSI